MSARRSTLAGLVSLCALAGGLAGLPATAAAEECPNAAFRTGPATHLPDCRAYEQVTPPFKNTAGLAWNGLSPDGSHVFLAIGNALAESEGFSSIGIIGFGPGAFYSTQRTASGWRTVPDDPPSSQYEAVTSESLGSDLAGESLDAQSTVWLDRSNSEPDNSIGLYLRRPDRSIDRIGPGLPPTERSEDAYWLGRYDGLEGVGVSADASRVFFKLGDSEQKAYWPFDTTAGLLSSLYEYVGVDNTVPMLVGVSDGSTVVGGRTLPAGELISQCGTRIGGWPNESTHNAVSTDGETVFFTAASTAECSTNGPQGSGPPVPELFARIDNGQAGARTVAISEPTKGDCAECDTEPGVLAGGYFLGASEDGSKVFFATTQPLLGGDASVNIYEYDFDAPAGKRVVRVSGGDATVTNPTANVEDNPAAQGEGSVQSVVSEDGSHVYFVARGVLTRTPNGRGESAEAGAANLYLFERDASYPAGRTVFVANTQLSFYDVYWEADATPDGRFLVFTSSRDLTPDDTSSLAQVFEYDAQTGSLVRVSIGQDGFNHDGNTLPAKIVGPFYGYHYRPSAYWTGLSVSADGAYVFFENGGALVPQAPEATQNVYEYHDGQVSLIAEEASLLGTDASGADVFFSSTNRLVGQDVDTQDDDDDARIDGGFPAPAEPASCSSDACQGALAASPTLLSPGSEFQAGSSPPLAGEPVVASKKKPKPRPKSGKRKRHAKGRGRKAKTAAVRGRTDRKAGRS